MAATTRKSRYGRVAIIVTSETNQLATAPGILRRVIVNNVSASATLDIYDNIGTTTTNKVFEWVSADGKMVREMDLPFQEGLKAISGTGTTPNFVLVWESA